MTDASTPVESASGSVGESASRANAVFIDAATLLQYGCDGCEWKNRRICPYGYTQAEEHHPGGYCPEMADFLFGLLNGEKSMDVLHERYLLYVQRMQARADRSKYVQYESELAELESKSYLEEGDRGRKNWLEAQIAMYRMWWMRLTEQTGKGYSRVNDRNSRKNQNINVSHKIELSQLHQLAADAREQLEHDEGEE